MRVLLLAPRIFYAVEYRVRFQTVLGQALVVLVAERVFFEMPIYYAPFVFLKFKSAVSEDFFQHVHDCHSAGVVVCAESPFECFENRRGVRVWNVRIVTQEVRSLP